MGQEYQHIDLFSGIGGFSLGLKQAGLNITKSYFSEIDKYAISVYRRNFPDAEYLGSVDTISGSRFKSGKLIITFGFPCQDLSVAGKRKGFDGSRSSLFFEAMRIISEVRPDIFIFENVKGFYSSNNGKDFTIALQTIADLGLYECQWQLLNTAWFLPQNRERVYLVGSLGTGDRPEVFPIQQAGRNHTKEGRSTRIGQLRTIDGGGFREMKKELCPSLTARCRQDGSGQPVIISNSAMNRKREQRANLPPLRSHSGCDHDNYVSMVSRPHGFYNGGEKKLPCLRSSSYEHNEVLQIKKAPCIRANHHNTADVHFIPKLYTMGNAKPGRSCLGASRTPEVGTAERSIRRLTPIECERLQGFPDNWTKNGHEGQEISDTQRYKMCGNAVSVPVVQAIGERLIA